MRKIKFSKILALLFLAIAVAVLSLLQNKDKKVARHSGAFIPYAQADVPAPAESGGGDPGCSGGCECGGGGGGGGGGGSC